MKKLFVAVMALSIIGSSLSYGAPKDMDSGKQERVIWGTKISPYVRKVLVALEEKKIAYELKGTLPTKLLTATGKEVPDDFAAASPLGKIPAYEERSGKKGEGFKISDSAVISEYLEQTNKNNPLRPQCPKANARVSWMIKYADDVIASLTHKVLFEKVVKPTVLTQETDKEAVEKVLTEELPAVLDYLEKTLTDDSRTWIADTKNLSLADIAVVSHLLTLQSAQEDLNALIGVNRPHLKAYVEKIAQRDSFKKALAA